MCGLFAIVFHDRHQIPNRASVEASVSQLGHRGPDGRGIFVSEGVALGHARLALVDLSSRSDQPLWDDSGENVIVYNGEIYNFRELRVELERAGVSFRTTSDTEVLLKGILHFGAEKFLPRLEGMFAFAVWNSLKKELTVARDRFGIKPLFIYLDNEKLLVASEAKAMRPWVSLTPDSNSMLSYLGGSGGPTRDRSFFSNVRSLAPGVTETFAPDRKTRSREFFQLHEFWDTEFHEELSSLSSQEVVHRFSRIAENSVEKHLIADAPVGALCSGGIDSSLVLALASRKHKDLALFHADVTGPLSERPAAEMLAKHLGLDLMAVSISDQDFITRMPEVLWHYEHPYSYHPNSVPFMMVSQLVRASGVKAVLSGEGSDECFLGYSPIAYEVARNRYRQFLGWLGRTVRLAPLIGKEIWPASNESQDIIHRLTGGYERDQDDLRIMDGLKKIGVIVSPRDTLSLRWLGYHLRTLLHRNDALGMRASIEARFPFLDHDLVRFAVNLPYRFKIRVSPRFSDRSHPFLRDKWVVREAALRLLPPGLARRRKLGFPVNAYDRMVVDPKFLLGGVVAQFLRIDRASLQHLISIADQQMITRLVMLESWLRMYFDGVTTDRLATDLESHVRITPVSEY